MSWRIAQNALLCQIAANFAENAAIGADQRAPGTRACGRAAMPAARFAIAGFPRGQPPQCSFPHRTPA